MKGLNNFPVKNGISQTLSPRTIMTGRPSLDYNKMSIEFGAYAQVFEDNNPTNTNKARTIGAIAIKLTCHLTKKQWIYIPLVILRKN